MEMGPDYTPAVAAAPAPAFCPVCHQPILPQYYFCPNCGANLHPAPLPTTPAAQTNLYIWSVVTPMLAFLSLSKWQGLKYYRSADPKAKQMGSTAFALIIISTLVVIYYTIVWTQNAIQSSVNSINADL